MIFKKFKQDPGRKVSLPGKKSGEKRAEQPEK